MRRALVVLTLGSLSLAACGGSQPQPTPPAAAPTTEPAPTKQAELIPRQVLFGNPDKEQARISPDGKQLSYLAPVDGVLNVWVGPIGDPSAAKPVTQDKKRGIRRYAWAFTNQHVLYLQDKAGDENWHVYSVDLASTKTIDLTPKEGVQARIQHVSPDHPDTIVVGLNDRDKRYHDLYRASLDGEKLELLQENPEYAGFVTDDDYQVHFAIKPTKSGGSQILRKQEDGFAPFLEIAMEDDLSTHPVTLSQDAKSLLMVDSRERDTAALTRVDVSDKSREILAEDKLADVVDVMTHPKTHAPQAVAAVYAQKHWQVLDPGMKKDFDVLSDAEPGELEVVDRSLDDQSWIVAYQMATKPVRYFHYDRGAKKLGFLFSNRPELDKQTLAEMHPVELRARDGKPLVSYLTLPAHVKAGGNVRQGKIETPNPLPMVLFVHGGPWGRDSWGYNPWHQWLANRGYAVLSVNYRGSTGFGKRFVNAGNKQWAKAMHDDLIDAVKWAVDAGVAKPDQVAIMGGSYGGYATLVGLTFTPEQFACGVDIVGPSNLITLLESIPPYWESFRQTFAVRVGDVSTEAGKQLLRERSPLTYADRIQRPLLIGQGANDPRVKQAESDQIVDAMQKKNIPVTYVLYPDEGHGFARPENRLSFNAVTEQFLAGCLGGRAQEYGKAFEGSSLTVKAGTEHVPGLKQALSATK